MTVSEVLEKQIEEASSLLVKIATLLKPVGYTQAPTAVSKHIPIYEKDIISVITEEVDKWQYKCKSILVANLGVRNKHTKSFENTVPKCRFYYDEKEGLITELREGRSVLAAVLEIESMKKHEGKRHSSISSKPPKVFISHKKEDKAYADALVNMIEFIVGADGEKIFCSSVQGYGIRQSRDIMDELKAQFDENEIFMIIIHSPRYYKSAVCLNEMGAAWVMGSRFSSFLTNDCKTDMMRGVINKEKIFIDPNDDPDMLEAHLNDFKNDLVSFFEKDPIDENKWANARRRFVSVVSALTYTPVAKADIDLFESLYIPAFEHIFDLLDIENFQRWAYPCAIGGNTVLKAYIFENLSKIPNYILSRPRHDDYASWDALMRNLGLLVSDFEIVYSQHAERIGDDGYVVERFYKRINPNPNYDRDLNAYNEHVMLVSDILFELARLCNLILSRIRGIYPNYKKELGILHIDNRITTPDLLYKESEISDAPYPGLNDYIKVRLTRETHLGNNPNIDVSGYEL